MFAYTQASTDHFDSIFQRLKNIESKLESFDAYKKGEGSQKRSITFNLEEEDFQDIRVDDTSFSKP